MHDGRRTTHIATTSILVKSPTGCKEGDMAISNLDRANGQVVLRPIDQSTVTAPVMYQRRQQAVYYGCVKIGLTETELGCFGEQNLIKDAKVD